MIDVSIIIPCFNRVEVIGNAIESIINQDYEGSIEIIVSDDGSTDNSLDYIRNKYEEVIIVEKPIDCKDQGASGARNRGLSISKGKYVAFLDSDDYYQNDFLSSMTKVLERDDSIGYVFCRVEQELKKHGSILHSSWTRTNLNSLDKKYHALNRAHCIWTGGIMVKRDVFNVTGFFDTNLEVGEDTDMWIRISEVCKGQFLDHIGVRYCIDGFSTNQLTKTHDDKQWISYKIVFNRALQRYNTNQLNDKIRLSLIRKGLYLSMCSQKTDTISRILRKLFIYFHLFIKDPVSSFVIFWNNEIY